MARSKVLPVSFFARPAPAVAEDLLGKYLVREIDSEIVASMITETEAYDGFDDQASHAYKGRTSRTEVMFGPPGRAYVYLIYGMHYLLNVVTGTSEYPSAVLIRSTNSVSGPGRVGKKFMIDKQLNNKPVNKFSKVWFEDRGVAIDATQIQTSGRIGVAYAGEFWSLKPWRFYLDQATTHMIK